MDKQESCNMNMIRGLVILYIVGVCHLDNYIGGVLESPVNTVMTYMCLGWLFWSSGYTISSIYSEQFSLKDTLSFLKKRFLRIYPLFLIVSIPFYFAVDQNFEKLINTLTFASIFTGKSMYTLWFVPVIFSCYVVFALGKMIHDKYRSIFLISLYIIMAISWAKFKIFEFRVIAYIPIFYLGCAAAASYKFKKALISKSSLISSILLFVAIIVADYVYHLKYYQIIFFSALVVISPLLIASQRINTSISSLDMFKKLSFASYVMYLTHRIFFTIISESFDKLQLEWKVLALYFIGIPLVIISSYLIQSNYNKQLIRITAQ